MQHFFFASVVGGCLVAVSVAIFYEVLAHVWVNLSRWTSHPKLQIILTIIAGFICHTAVIWLFGISFYLLQSKFGFGELKGEINGLLDYVYFSGVTYSSLGLGDVYPTGNLRLLIAIEAILGLILIGWTIAYTYIFTEKYLAHRLNRQRKK